MRLDAARQSARDALAVGLVLARYPEKPTDFFEELVAQAGPGWLVEVHSDDSSTTYPIKLKHILAWKMGDAPYRLLEPLAIHNPHSPFVAGDRVTCTKREAGDVYQYLVQSDPAGSCYIRLPDPDCDCDGCRGLSRDPQWRFMKVESKLKQADLDANTFKLEGEVILRRGLLSIPNARLEIVSIYRYGTQYVCECFGHLKLCESLEEACDYINHPTITANLIREERDQNE